MTNTVNHCLTVILESILIFCSAKIQLSLNLLRQQLPWLLLGRMYFVYINATQNFKYMQYSELPPPHSVLHSESSPLKPEI